VNLRRLENQSRYFALCVALDVSHRLRIEVHGYTAVGMPQQLLHGLHIFSVRLQNRRERMTKRMSSHLGRDLGSFESRPDVHAKDGEGPVRELFLACGTGEDSITIHRVSRLPSPHQQNASQLRIERDWFLRCFRLARAHALKGNGPGHVQFEVLEVHVGPFQSE